VAAAERAAFAEKAETPDASKTYDGIDKARPDSACCIHEYPVEKVELKKSP